MATVNTNDERLQKYESTKNNLINEAQTNYNKTSSGAEEKYNELIQATEDYGKTQTELTQAKTDQTIAEINQNKDKAEKDYIKEQKSAYTDYAKQTNAYGTNAEVQASAGLAGSGYSESSKVNMYNTYQNRYSTARESYNQVVLGYDNQIAQAKLQNNSLLAEIAFNTLQTGLQLALEGFQYQNELLNNLFNQKLSVSSTYDNLWQSQYNTLLNEAQFNEQMAYQKQRDAIADSQWQQQFNLSRANASRTFTGDEGDDKEDSGDGNFTEDKKSNANEIEKTLRSRFPEGMDDNPMSLRGGMKYKEWEANSIKYIEAQYDAGKITYEERVDLISKLGLGA